MLGTIIKEKYDVKKLIAESCFYEVYQATEAETGTTVAIKILTEEMSKNDVRVKTFSDETAIFAKMSHPLVAQVYDFDSLNQRPFLVTEFVEGMDLRSWSKAEEVSLFDAIHTVRQIADVLKYAHEQGVQKRNIKPSNIVREKSGKIRVLSFSLPRLKLVGNDSEPDADAGTQSDLFFLGTTLYELLSGESPIRKRGGINELWDNKLKQALRIRHPHMSPEEIDRVIDFIEKTFTRELKKRFENHAEFMKHLFELGKIAEKACKPARATTQKAFASASEVVDAIQGRPGSGAKAFSAPLPDESSREAFRGPIPATLPKIAPKSGPIQIHASSTWDAPKGGKPSGQTGNAGQAALAVAEEPLIAEEDLPKFGRPILELIKGGRDTAKSVIWKYSEDQPIHRNPIVLISSAILLMLLLVLFW